jgi:peptide-methionine (S)-S-oxide reductase
MSQQLNEIERPTNSDQITLAGGCFWCIEAVLEMVGGVDKVESGYTGGHVANPSYEQVCSGTTGHAEAVRVTFDPGAVSLSELLEIFFNSHDPTTLNRQGPDTGSQYRSAIFYDGLQQEEIVEKHISNLTHENVWHDPIVTEVLPLATFYPAEDYHSEYFRSNPYSPYSQYIIAPKVAKFQKTFFHRLKSKISG